MAVDWVKCAIEAGGGEGAVRQVFISSAMAYRDLLSEGVLNAKSAEFRWDFENKFLMVTRKREKRAVPFSAIGEIRFREG